MRADPDLVRGYVLAGGRSSRMGEDKSAIRLGGTTLLERAIGAMEEVTASVTVIGGGRPLSVSCAQPRIDDEFRDCGPLGGIEAALRDCGDHRASWAVLLPADMPLVPAGLLRAMVHDWIATPFGRIGMPVVDGTPQPLVSVMHVDARPALRAALAQGAYKLQPVLRAAAVALADRFGVGVEEVFVHTSLALQAAETGDEAAWAGLGWRPSAAEDTRRAMWFVNANTPADLELVRRSFGPDGESPSSGASAHLRKDAREGA